MSARTRLFRAFLFIAAGAVLLQLVTWLPYLAVDVLGDAGTAERLLTLAWMALPAGVLGGGGVVFWYRRKLDHEQETYQSMLEAQGVTAFVLPRRDQDEVKLAAFDIWTRIIDLLNPGEHISFEMSGSEASAAFTLRALPKTLRAVMNEVRSEWPGTRMSPIVRDRKSHDPLFAQAREDRAWVEVRPTRWDIDLEIGSLNPLVSFLAAITQLPFGQRAGLQILVRPDVVTNAELARKVQKLAGELDKIEGASFGKTRKKKQLDELTALSERRFLEVLIRVWASGGDQREALDTARQVARGLAAQFEAKNRLKVLPGRGPEDALESRDFDAFQGWPWTETGVGYIAHILGSEANDVAPQLRFAPAKPLPPSNACRIPASAITWEKAGTRL